MSLQRRVALGFSMVGMVLGAYWLTMAMGWTPGAWAVIGVNFAIFGWLLYTQ